ncbi:MAG: PQQ-binding-like beta-propeller repeat protein [Hyphomonadaceae bacterium]|nr:PQQ-binding-like beta-propeller repeat protein [Hyphomonadaceae bacterium]
MTTSRTIAVLLAAAALAGCGTVGRAADSVWPFNGGGDDAPAAPEEGRISILTFEQQLAPDPDLQARAIVVPAPAPSGDWSQPGGNSANAPINVTGPSNFENRGGFSVGAGSSDRVRIAASPVIQDGKLYFLDAEHVVRAVDARSGRTLWSQRMRPEEGRDRRAMGGGVAAGDGRIYVTSGFGFAAALNAQSGDEVWRTRTNAPFHAAPTFAGGKVYAVTNDSELVAMDAATGQIQWTHQAIAEPARILAASSPAVSGDTVIAPFASGEVVALLAANGRRLWVDALTRAGRLTSLSAINDVAGRPAVDNGVVYAASHSGILAAIDLRTGQRLWARTFASTQTPWIAGDVLYAVTVDGELTALDKTSGKVYWVRQLPRFEDSDDRKGRISWTGPIMVAGRLILGNSLGQATAVSPVNGEIVETRKVGDPIYISPVAADDAIYFVGDNARVVALR